jgi:hypothetical protein
MRTLGACLQILGLVIAPLGLLHSIAGRGRVPDSTLMTWELGCLLFGALCFLAGRRFARGDDP